MLSGAEGDRVKVSSDGVKVSSDGVKVSSSCSSQWLEKQSPRKVPMVLL